MRIILLGAPGAGKGSQAVNLTKVLKIPHISTGDIFRANIREKTELGKLVKGYIDKGQLVPDEVTIQIVKDRLVRDDCKKGFLLDGFPRTIAQAESLEKVLYEMGADIDAVINLEADDNLIIERLANRRVCSCGRIFHLLNSPPAVGEICDSCGCELVVREDDKRETVKNRLVTYHLQTEPLVHYYEKKGLLMNIDGDGRIDDITDKILKKLEKA